MQFNKLVAVIAILGLSFQANAYSDGTLRRSVQVAQNDTTVVTESEPAQGVVIMNSNTSTNTTPSSASSAAVSQPTTVVEAAPVTESKAELMRKARQGEEVKTEQKIVEKLEESRLREEQQRAERLFGNKLDAPPAAAAATATAVATPDAAAATATAVERVCAIDTATGGSSCASRSVRRGRAATGRVPSYASASGFSPSAARASRAAR